MSKDDIVTATVGVCASPDVELTLIPVPATKFCTKSPTVSVAKSIGSFIQTLPLYLKTSPLARVPKVTSFISANVSSVATCAST